MVRRGKKKPCEHIHTTRTHNTNGFPCVHCYLAILKEHLMIALRFYFVLIILN